MEGLSFGKRLKALRIKANLRQNEIAKKLTISRQSISKWEQDTGLPQINYLVPLIKILDCSLEDLFNIKEIKKKDNMIKDNFKVIACKYLHGSLYNGIKKVYNNDKYFDYKVKEINYCNDNTFFIVGIINSEIIGTCFVERHEDNPNYFLISDFFVLKEQRNKGFGLRLIDSALSILEDHNAFKIGVFAENDISKKVFTRFGFIKDDSVKSFGRIIPGSDDDVYYELNLNIDIILEKINKENAKFAGLIMTKYTKKYAKEMPKLLKPNFVMWKNHLMKLNLLDNGLLFVINCGKVVIGYTYMFYEDYNEDHYVNLQIILDENHLYEEAINIAIKKAKQFFNEYKQKHKLAAIKVMVNSHNIIMDQATFYKNTLLKNGFKTNDNEVYYLK